MVYRCEPCDAYVGCHPGTKKALGRLANSELRKAKSAAHRSFDKIWKNEVEDKKRGAFLAGRATTDRQTRLSYRYV